MCVGVRMSWVAMGWDHNTTTVISAMSQGSLLSAKYPFT